MAMKGARNCKCCGKRRVSTAAAAEAVVLYVEQPVQMRREFKAGALICAECLERTVPHGQLHMFIAPPGCRCRHAGVNHPLEAFHG